jgi:hypothetical protein
MPVLEIDRDCNKVTRRIEKEKGNKRAGYP